MSQAYAIESFLTGIYPDEFLVYESNCIMNDLSAMEADNGKPGLGARIKDLVNRFIAWVKKVIAHIKDWARSIKAKFAKKKKEMADIKYYDALKSGVSVSIDWTNAVKSVVPKLSGVSRDILNLVMTCENKIDDVCDQVKKTDINHYSKITIELDSDSLDKVKDTIESAASELPESFSDKELTRITADYGLGKEYFEAMRTASLCENSANNVSALTTFNGLLSHINSDGDSQNLQSINEAMQCISSAYRYINTCLGHVNRIEAIFSKLQHYVYGKISSGKSNVKITASDEDHYQRTDRSFN